MPPAPVSESTAPRAMVFPAAVPALGVAVPVVVLLLQAERVSVQIASTAAALRPKFRSPVPDMARNATDLRARTSAAFRAMQEVREVVSVKKSAQRPF